ncbi:MAG TPA: hypothetical protein PKZ42_11010 [Syntrophales bacterium]|nr:hypothetical protein [Syntrophales bacterium]
MTGAIHVQYKKIPSLFFLRVPLYALWGKTKHFNGKESIPPISAAMTGLKINRKHLSRFNKICTINNSDEISLIYPITLVFPLFQRILSLKQAPLSMFNVLGKNLKITQYRNFGFEENFDIFCEISSIRIVSKGLELDLSAVIQIAEETVWTATETFFYRGQFGEPDKNLEKDAFESISDAKILAEWFLPSGNGFGFARISGDGNGIHYSKFYARLFGFERDFAQPFLILGNTLKYLNHSEINGTISLSVAFKGQFYYDKNVTIKGVETNGRNRFDIYSDGNDNPCMSGILNNEMRN